mgnify:CR=1 FL=1|tara:strand:- start:418 stop:795 length:378 start_codon:yes stop_codon:yes gene_type:complete
MAKEKHSADKVTESTLHELLTNINTRLEHLEDIEADNRDFIIKLVKQGNQIVKFLQNIEIEDVTDDFDELMPPTLSRADEERSERIQHIKEVVEKYMSKHKDLKEFEKELKKYKDEITPGTIGES